VPIIIFSILAALTIALYFVRASRRTRRPKATPER
jgi:hypothetical protein